MVMIDRFTKKSDTCGVAVKLFSRDDYGCEGGFVIQGILIECVAQAVAAHHGVERLENTPSAPAMGMLVAIDEFEFLSPVPDHAEIRITVEKTDEIGPFHLILGQVFYDHQLMASGRIKIYNHSDLHASDA